jgi:hypothetical protein
MQGADTELFETLDAQILPGEGEKSKLLTMFNDLRKESTFCDVAFLCKGTLFRAHRVVVSGWSRWLRALLSEGSPEEVVHLDVFEPAAFSSILDYMYGSAVTVTVDSAERLLKVVRRLELHGLEQSVWIFLMKAIDARNCNHLHELADRYDCPPLKLAAWRYIQQAISGPSKHFNDKDLKKIHKGTGLTGPGETSFYRNVTMQERTDEQRSLADAVSKYGGIISAHTRPKDLDNLGDDEDKQQDSADERESVDLNQSIDGNLGAADFVKAWSRRLNAVYEDCMVSPHELRAGADTTMGSSSSPQRTMVMNSRARDSGAGLSQPADAASNTVGAGSFTLPPPPRAAAGTTDRRKKAPSSGDIDWHSELKGFYLGINLAEKLPFLDEILQANAGREEQMLSHLIMKYKRVIPQSLANHLDTLQGFLETHTESDFRR